MKKVLSIVFAMLILVSGLHVSVASHICGGEVAAVKWSVTGENATCGMENIPEKNPVSDAITSNCCQDEVSVYRVDHNYSPSNFQIKQATTHILQVFSTPVGITLRPTTSSLHLYTSVSPRDKLQISAVRQDKICVFLI